MWKDSQRMWKDSLGLPGVDQLRTTPKGFSQPRVNRRVGSTMLGKGREAWMVRV